MKKLAIITCLGLFLAMGCDDKGKAPTETATTAAATKAATATAKTTAVAADKPDPLDKEDIPVAADYEDKAEKEVTEANLNDKLAELEKELGAGESK